MITLVPADTQLESHSLTCAFKNNWLPYKKSFVVSFEVSLVNLLFLKK